MRAIKRRSAVPVYIAAAVFAVYALVLPLYSLWHFLIAALVTASAWLLADRLVKPVIEYVPDPEAETVSFSTPADIHPIQASDDVDMDIRVMKQLMTQDDLAGEDELHQLLRQVRENPPE